MPAPAWEDLTAFLSTDDFAILATFTRANGQVIPDVPGIFDEAVMNVEAGEYDMAAGSPRFTCAHAPVAALKKNDAATVYQVDARGAKVLPGVAYLLDHDPHPDGTGMALLQLSQDFDT